MRRDVARRASGGASDPALWTNRMVDRIGLLIPRLATRDQSVRVLGRALADTRTGQAAGELWKLLVRVQGAEARAVMTRLLSDLAAYFRTGSRCKVRATSERLLAGLEAARTALTGEDEAVRAQALACLSSLRRDLRLHPAEHGVQP
jgi:hypothetical protein